ncbi:MAG TPA: hypothetical protein ENO33_00835 [Hydrogenobaculum sp.]|nr:hypothetical protein [Hydrogenobaculum sp.]
MSYLENYDKNIPSSDYIFKTLMKKKENIQALIEVKYPVLSKHLDFETITFIDTESYNTDQELKTHYDMACEIKLKNTNKKIELYFIFEHKSYQDKYILAQLLSYISSKFNESKRQGKEIPKIVPIAVYVGEKEWNIPTSIVYDEVIDEDLKKYIFDFEYLLITPQDFKDIEKEVLRRSLELYAYIKLVEFIANMESFDIAIKEIYTHISDKGTLKLFLIELYKTNRVDFKQLNDKLLELSQGGISMKNLIEDAMEYAKKEGIKEGEIKAIREIILGMVRNYFQQEDILDIESKLNNINDYDKLKDLTFKILTFKSIEELRSYLNSI